MSAWGDAEELEEQPDGHDPLPDEEEPASGGDDAEGFDDLPETHLSDEEYERFAASEFDRHGREKGAPPVTAILLGITVAIFVVWALFFR